MFYSIFLDLHQLNLFAIKQNCNIRCNKYEKKAQMKYHPCLHYGHLLYNRRIFI